MLLKAENTFEEVGILKNVRVGLIGCGYIVEECHLPGIFSQGVRPDFAAIADPDPERLEKLGSLLGVPKNRRYTDYRDLLRRTDDIDVVSIATPHNHHATQIREAAEAGVNIICEKPMAISVAEARSAIEAVERRGVFFTTVHNLLYSPAMREALRQISDGFVGKPLMSRGQHFYRKPPVLPAGDWRTSVAAGGGCLIDTSYHEIYSVEALMGSPIRQVQAMVRTLNYNIEADDISLMMFEHENGGLSTVSAAWFAPSIGHEKGRWCEVHESLGSVRVNHRCVDAFERVPRSSEAWETLSIAGQNQDVTAATDARTDRWPSFYEVMRGGPKYSEAQQDPTGHGAFLVAALEAVATGSAPPVPARQALHLMAVISAAQQASQTRQSVVVEA